MVAKTKGLVAVISYQEYAELKEFEPKLAVKLVEMLSLSTIKKLEWVVEFCCPDSKNYVEKEFKKSDVSTSDTPEV